MDTDGGSRPQDLYPPPSIPADWLVGNEQRGRRTWAEVFSAIRGQRLLPDWRKWFGLDEQLFIFLSSEARRRVKERLFCWKIPGADPPSSWVRWFKRWKHPRYFKTELIFTVAAEFFHWLNSFIVCATHSCVCMYKEFLQRSLLSPIFPGNFADFFVS